MEDFDLEELTEMEKLVGAAREAPREDPLFIRRRPPLTADQTLQLLYDWLHDEIDAEKAHPGLGTPRGRPGPRSARPR